jgi:soluble lytic murein transglycosylase-like protein
MPLAAVRRVATGTGTNLSGWRLLWRRPAVRRGAAAAAALLLVAGLVLVGRRDQLPRPEAGSAEEAAVARAASEPIAGTPIDEWTLRFGELQERGEWDVLAQQLEAIREHQKDDWERYDLQYLLARARLEAGDLDGAAEALEPYLREGHGLRDLALHHRARIAARLDEAKAAPYREQLILQYPASPYREVALEAHLAWLEKQGDPAPLRALASRLGGVSKDVQRDLASRLVLLESRTTPPAETVERGLRLLRDQTGDDPGDRVFRALDKPEVLSRLSPEDKVLLGEAARGHRHYDRAVELLNAGLAALPARREDLLYSIGRAHFGAERFAEAEQAYLKGVEAAKTNEQKAVFLYHASRAAQLVGQDTRAEVHLAKAISVGAGTPRAATALTQRIRTRMAAGRVKEAAEDWKTLRKRHPRDRALYEGSLAYAVGLIARGDGGGAREALRTVPRRLVERADEPELAYWLGRSWEAKDPARAVEAWKDVLRTTYPTHFDVFVRERLREPRLRKAADARIEKLKASLEGHLDAGRSDAARAAQAEAYLLSTPDRAPAELRALTDVYRRLPVYRDILQLARQALPRLPLTAAAQPAADGLRTDRHDLLLALGLHDDAVDLISQRYALAPAAVGLTRAQALAEAGATRGAIGAAESTMQRVPDDFLAELLPPSFLHLLYPREYADVIATESRKHGADPRLVLSIMREESRFNPRAKSPAAARGLLQFIIGTARDVGTAIGLVEVEPEDLYDPDVIIQLGARYIGDLLKQFEGDPYRAAAAYNAGPVQTRLWSRLQAGPGRDYFLTAVNFDETKNYVRKVMNSYHRYGEVYGPNLDQRAGEGQPAAAPAD